MQKQDGNLSLLQWTCRSILQSSFPLFRNADIEASFYPYIGLTHTIRRKGQNRWVIRVSDHCRRAPRQVLEAIAIILGSKITHKKPPDRFLEIYERFRKDPYIEESVRERRRERGRKNIAGCEGAHHSLLALYREVNNLFFNNQIEIQKIGWGLRKGWRRLGHYDPVHHTITLSPALDSPKVPEFVVRYIVYHEMLHALFEADTAHRRGRHHSPEFHRAERAYPDFARSKTFLRDYFLTRRAKFGAG
jgi:predicted metal-dependent hydrolase